MRFLVILLLLLSLAISCDTSKESKEETPDEIKLNEYIVKTNERLDPECKGNTCAKVTITYAEFKKGPNEHQSFNQIIQNKIHEILTDYTFDDSGDPVSDEIIDRFFKNYQAFKRDFPESITPWEITIDVVVSYTQNNFITLAFNTSSYTGGAHSLNQVEYINISKEGEILTSLSKFVKDTVQLKKKAEEKFRAQYQLSPDQDLAEAGFMFEDDQFQLTDNFGFTRNGLIFYYNSYEVAPYATGPTAITIPFEELQKMQ